jgi:arylsulfatase A-like enzyme
MGDLGDSHSSDGSPMSYFRWEKNTNGSLEWVERYATTDTVDDAIERIDVMEPPWLIWVAFNAPHAPWHTPPDHLTTDPVGDTSTQRKYNGMVEAMDTELARLLDHLDASGLAEETLVIAMGDNGTPPDAISPPFDADHAKASIYEGGVRVPLIVRGPPVEAPGRRIDHLVQVSDLFATVAEVAEVDLREASLSLDSRSLVPYLSDPAAPPRRETVYSETFGPLTEPYTFSRRMVRDDRYKLVEKWREGLGHLYELYDLEGLDSEGPNLMLGVLTPEQHEAYLELSARLPWDAPS